MSRKYKFVDLIISKANSLTPDIQDTPRKNWGRAFKKMHSNGEDSLIIPDIFVEETYESIETGQKN